MVTLQDLPRVMEEAGYEREFLARVAAATRSRGVDVAALEEMTLEVTGANILGRVFYMGREVERGDLEGVLSAGLCEVLMREGILRECGEGRVRAECAVVPVGGGRGFWFFRDFDGWARGGKLGEDHVLGVGMASGLLADLTVRRRGGRVLDVGTGQGFQAGMAARHADRVVGTDINRRALRLAGWAMRMNGIGNVELREGSFFEPVAGEKFDLVVSNPPFVIAPPQGMTGIAGEWVGDAFVEGLVRRVPEFLEEGGWATVIGNWHHASVGEWAGRPAAWVAGTGVDAWVVKFKTEEPWEYAANWLRERALAEGEDLPEVARGKVEEWTAYLHSLGIGGISMGAVILRKRTALRGGAANWVRTDAMDLGQLVGEAGEQVQRLFAGETMLRGLRQESEVLDQRLAVSASSELVQRLRRAAGEWSGAESVLRQSAGFGFEIGLAPLPAMILARLDGTRRAREVIAEVAAGMGADSAVAFAQTAPFLVKMVRMTHVGVMEPPG